MDHDIVLIVNELTTKNLDLEKSRNNSHINSIFQKIPWISCRFQSSNDIKQNLGAKRSTKNRL